MPTPQPKTPIVNQSSTPSPIATLVPPTKTNHDYANDLRQLADLYDNFDNKVVGHLVITLSELSDLDAPFVDYNTFAMARPLAMWSLKVVEREMIESLFHK